MKTKFCIISFFDPYGDEKSSRKEFGRKNFTSSMSIEDIQKVVYEYNAKVDYYSEVRLKDSPDKRLRSFANFGESRYMMN